MGQNEHQGLDANVEAVRQKLLDRSKAGFKKYGVTTERDDLTTDQWLVHLQEELLDAAVYCERLRKEIERLRRWTTDSK